jgi:excisionase family DNA binding protein
MHPGIHTAGRTRSPRFLTVSEIADLLRVAERTVRRWIKVGDLVAHKIGGAVRISEADLETFLASRRRVPKCRQRLS